VQYVPWYRLVESGKGMYPAGTHYGSNNLRLIILTVISSVCFDKVQSVPPHRYHLRTPLEFEYSVCLLFFFFAMLIIVVGE